MKSARVLQLPDAPRQPDRPIEMAVNHRIQRDAVEQAIAIPGAELIERRPRSGGIEQPHVMRQSHACLRLHAVNRVIGRSMRQHHVIHHLEDQLRIILAGRKI